MLILTTNALIPGSGADPLPDWPGLRVLLVLPGSGLNRAAIEALNEAYVIVEWLQSPANMVDLLCDAAGWLENRLIQGEGPLLCLDQPVDAMSVAIASHEVQSNAVQADFDTEGRMVQLVLGEMIATSPLLPAFLRMVGKRAIEDVVFIELLNDVFTWKDA